MTYMYAHSQTIRQAEHHLLYITTEWSVCAKTLDDAKASITAHFTTEGTFSPPPPAPHTPQSTTPIKAHCGFNRAQQVFYPNDPLQPGPMYYLTPRKCLEVKPLSKLLIDEAVDMGRGSNTIVSTLHHSYAVDKGKGSNTIISMLHHYFVHHALAC